MADLTVYFVAPEQDVIGDGENVDMFVAASSTQEAADLFAACWEVEIEDPICIHVTEEKVDGEPRVLDWDGRRDLRASMDLSKLPTETATAAWRYPVSPQP
jgi:hypothetical protein